MTAAVSLHVRPVRLGRGRRLGRSGLDVVGTAMGIATIPMALLSVASMAAGLALLATGNWGPVAAGLIAVILALAFAYLLEGVVRLIEGSALGVQRRSGRSAGLRVGLVSGVLPVVVILAWEYWAWARFSAMPGPRPLPWLLSYGVATAPWSLFGGLMGSDRRTLVRIRAYAGHLSYWLLSIAMVAHAPAWLVALVMALPAILPGTVGTLLAVADRDALRNVQI